MTSTVVPPRKAVAEWLKVFHAQGTESYTSSLTFAKRLTVVAMSTITYMKNLFPENCFTEENFAGLKLKILKNKCKDELAQFVSTALTEAFDALDKKYLHQLALCIYEDECKQENLIEYHIFEYTYNSEGVAMSIHTKDRNNKKKSLKCTCDDVQSQTTRLIRTCIVMMQSCTELPEYADIVIRLYYNDDAPEDYQAPGYRCDNSGEDHLESTRSEAIKLGSVESPYHKITAKSYLRDNLRDSYEANASSNAPVMPLSQSEGFSGSAQRSAPRTSPEMQLKCPCSKYEGTASHDTPMLLITCYYCNTMQHATCFGLLPEHVSGVKRHCCTSCSDENPDRAPTDVRLTQLTYKKRECLCIFRRTLEWCTQVSFIDGPSLVARFGISLVNANKLLKLLDSYGIICLEPDSDANKINVEELNVQISKYFQNNEENDLGDHLLAETFASQETKHDQIGDVLSPLEKITLQNTSNLGRVIKTSNKDVVMEHDDDPILRHYKDAIISGISEEPVIEGEPLDGSQANKDGIETRSATAKKGFKRKMKDSSEIKVDRKRLRAGLKNKNIKNKEAENLH